MPLEITQVPPSPAFSVEYQGETLWIYHTYEDDIESRRVEQVYTADEKEGVRDGQRRCGGIQGQYGFTVYEHRDEYFFDTHKLLMEMASLPEFDNPTKRYSSDWQDKFIVQTAINYGLIGFDEDYRFVDTTMIEEPIKSLTGGLIQPIAVKAVSNG